MLCTTKSGKEENGRSYVLLGLLQTRSAHVLSRGLRRPTHMVRLRADITVVELDDTLWEVAWS